VRVKYIHFVFLFPLFFLISCFEAAIYVNKDAYELN